MPAWDVTIGSTVLFLRTGRTDAANKLLEDVTSDRCRLPALYNAVWIKYIKEDVNRDDDIDHWLNDPKPEAASSDKGQGSKRTSTYVYGGSPMSINYLSNSISHAVLKHNVVPSDTTLTNLVLFTLRMIPADLKSVRQQVVNKSTAQHEMDSLKEEASRDDKTVETSKYHDLAPPSDTGYLSSLNSIYESNIPIVRRPIPVDPSHKHARHALGPIWELLKEFISDLSLSNLVTLMRGFNKATLITPTLYLLPHIARHARGDPKTAAEGYYYALKTLVADVRYEDAYALYRDYLRPKNAEHPTWTFVLEHKRLLGLTLQGVARSAAATREEKEKLFNIAHANNALTGDALASYAYAMSRDASVRVTDLSSIYDRCRDLPLEKHTARFMNDIFFGYSARGAFNLAHQVLSDMWERGATISGHSVRLFLDRCVSTRQIDLVEDVLQLMRPANPYHLHRDVKFGRKSETTSRRLPVVLSVPVETYEALLIVDIRINDVKHFQQHLDDYVAVEKYTLTRALLKDLLAVAAQLGRAQFISPILSAFQNANILPDLRTMNTVLYTYAQARDAETAIGWFESFKQKGMAADEFTYAALARLYAKSFNVDKAIDVLTEMEDANVPITPIIFEALVEALAPISLEKAEWIIAHMESIGVKPSLGLYKALLTGYANAGNIQMFQQHLHYVIESSGLPLAPFFCNSLIDSLSLLGDFESLQEWLLPVMKREGIEMSFHTLGSLLLAYYRLGKHDLVEETLKDLPNRHRLQSQARYASVVFLPSLRYLALNDLPRAWNLIETMQKQCGIPVGQDLLASMLSVLDSPNSSRRAEALAWMKANLHPTEFEALERTIKTQPQYTD